MTLAYPDNRQQPFRDLLMGRMQRIVVHIDLLMADEQVQGDYFNDKQFKRQFQLWLSEVWQRKDQRLEQIYKAD